MRRAWLQRLVPLLAALCFLLSGLDAAGQGQRLLAVLDLAAAVLNLATPWLVRLEAWWLPGALQLVNVPVALAMSWSYFRAGKIGLPWAWLGAAVVFLVVGVAWILRSNPGRIRGTERKTS